MSMIGLNNGTRLLVLATYPNHIKVRILSGEHAGAIHFLFRIFCLTDETQFHLKLKRYQFPIRPCFAMTINKSQGQGIDCVGINLQTPVFTHGQLYVALSRATDPSHVFVFLGTESKRTRNIVFNEVLI